MSRFAVVGPGRAGSTLAGALAAAGHVPTGVWGRSPQQARRVAQKLRTTAHQGPDDALSSAEWIIFAVPDAAIASVAQDFARSGFLAPQSVLIHLAGAWGPDILPGGWPRLAVHPCASLRGFGQSLQGMPLVAEADAPAAEAAAALIATSTGAHLLQFPGTDRSRYHALCALSANLVPALLYTITRQCVELGFTREEADHLVTSLVESGWQGVRSAGTAGFTGPLVRGDEQTVQRHLAALDDHVPVLAQCYRLLSQVLVESLAATVQAEK